MPTMSRSLLQPWVTPWTALKTSARVRPWKAAALSLSRSMLSTLPSLTRLMPGAINAETLPLGPSTSTVLPSTVYFTPAGNGIGFLPIRDIAYSLCGLRVLWQLTLPNSTAAREHCSPYYHFQITTAAELRRRRPPVRPELPDFAEDLAAYAFAAGLTTGHDALGGGHDRDTQSALDALDLVAANVYTAAGTRDASQVTNGSFGARAVLQVHAQDGLALFVLGLVVRDIALFLKNAGNLKE